MLGIFLDTETTGLNPCKHHLLEIAYKVVDVQTGEIKHAFSSIISIDRASWDASDPASLNVHQFSWEEVCRGSSAELVKDSILQAFDRLHISRGKAVFICQNPSFDRAFFSKLIDPDTQEMLFWPYHWLDLASMYWVENIRKAKSGKSPFPWETGVSKDQISAAYKLPPENRPHRAMNGVDHLLLCYEAVVGFPSKNLCRT